MPFLQVVDCPHYEEPNDRQDEKVLGVVSTEFYDGQGLGNQLWVYAVTRVAAKRTGQEYAILGRQRFKGRSFLDLDFGLDIKPGLSLPGGPPIILPEGISVHLSEDRQVVMRDGMDVSGVDARFLAPPPNTKLDGNMQSVTYVLEELSSIRDWIKPLEPQIPLMNYCAIHVRLGDFTGKDGPFVGWDYYLNGIEFFLERDPATVFKCVSDDIAKCKEKLPSFIQFEEADIEDRDKAKHHFGGPIQKDFQILTGAKNLLISNSSFSWWAAVLNAHKDIVLAPKYWARYNISDGLWSTSDILTPGFHYLAKSGSVETFEEVLAETRKHKKLRDDAIISVPPKSVLARVIELVYGSILGILVRTAKGILNIKAKDLAKPISDRPSLSAY
jgi:hypothetical protein